MEYPNILVLAGHEPSGGAGLQADIEAIAAQDAHAATVATMLVCHDTHSLYDVSPVADGFFQACIERLLADMRFAAIKIGAVANGAQIRIIHQALAQLADVPLVIDPVLNANDGGRLGDDPIAQALVAELFDQATVITPNAAEARLLCDGETDLAACGERLAQSAGHVLITGGDEPGDNVTNTLYSRNDSPRTWRWPRLEGRYLGAGCTLASTLAARLAHGDSPAAAIAGAQQVTWDALAAGMAVGTGQPIPRRIRVQAKAQP
ncbi:MAG TPA: hydroxymethylpyrimidine/phosphomethylpyrimidine kinase [Salinisphaeraceae bacterium]|nr:hydroxymethylpyrimidine/phosphomethylpyrimidine kinase [Salinisphaeraceae bacterium]